MKKTVKIPYEYWMRIRNYKKDHIKEMFFMYFYMEKINNSTYRVYAKERLWIFLLIFPIELLVTVIWCIWDGGLREFELPTRYQTSSYIYFDCDAFDVCEVLWDADTRSE